MFVVTGGPPAASLDNPFDQDSRSQIQNCFVMHKESPGKGTLGKLRSTSVQNSGFYGGKMAW